IALDLDDDKLALARRCGADLTLNPSSTDVVAQIQNLTGGYGADTYFEGTGNPASVSQGLALLRRLGTFVEYAVFKEIVSVDWSIISDDKRLDVRGERLGTHGRPAAVQML